MSEKSAKKKRHQTKGLKPTSVVRELKKGSGIEKCRVSEGAAAATVKETERALKILGESAYKMLKIAKAKTVTKEMLATCIDTDLMCKGFSSAAARSGVASKDRSKKDRRSIATASAVRSFGQGCPLGKNANRITGSGRDALSAIAEAYIRELAHDAARYATSAHRQTLKATDIAAVISQRG